MTKLTWLPVTCFCPKDNWSLLFKAIDSFITCNQSKIVSYRIYFSRTYGDSVLFPVLVNQSEIDELAAAIDECLTDFFVNMDLLVRDVEVTGIILPYPSTTIQFGLYSLRPVEVNDYKVELDFELSKLILKTLQDEDVDDGLLVSFAIYLEIALLKKIYCHANSWNLVNSFVCSRFGSERLLDLDDVNLNEHQAVLEEIWEEIDASSNYTKGLFWLNEWISIIENLFANESRERVAKLALAQVVYNQLIALIYIHLNLDIRTQKLISHLIKLSLLRRGLVT